MKRMICFILALIVLAATGCAGARLNTFAVVTAKTVNLEYMQRLYRAENAPDISAFAKSLFNALYEDGENLACSPVSVYLALAMLAGVTGGESQKEILDALGAGSLDELKAFAIALIESETFKEKDAECSFANSLWMNDNVEYNMPTLEMLRDAFSADVFSGDPGKASYSEALRTWLNERTDGLLKDAVENVSLDPDLVLAIASTVLFDAEWSDEFKKENTREDVFHAPTGDITCDMMYKEEFMPYVGAEGFSAVGKRMVGGATMWFLLPDEGVGLSDIVYAIGSLKEWETYDVRFTMPKLDISSELDLLPALEKLGIKSCLNPYAADFSPLTALDEVCVTEATHAARVKADEKRVRAAAFTLIMAENAAMPMPGEIIDFTLDRPFLFVITGACGAPLFVGAVNRPGA